MNPYELILLCNKKMIAIRVQAGDIALNGPKGSISRDLMFEVRRNKIQIRRILDNCISKSECHYMALRPYLKCKVMTPDGSGTLWQIFRTRAGVILDGLPEYVTFYNPAELETTAIKRDALRIEAGF